MSLFETTAEALLLIAAIVWMVMATSLYLNPTIKEVPVIKIVERNTTIEKPVEVIKEVTKECPQQQCPICVQQACPACKCQVTGHGAWSPGNTTWWYK